MSHEYALGSSVIFYFCLLCVMVVYEKLHFDALINSQTFISNNSVVILKTFPIVRTSFRLHERRVDDLEIKMIINNVILLWWNGM